MAYSYDENNTRRGNESNNLVIYSYGASGPEEVRLPNGVSFGTVFRTAKGFFFSSYDSYSGSMYKKESRIRMTVNNGSGGVSTIAIKVDLTEVDHVIGLPHEYLIATHIGGNEIPVRTEKGFIDYLNYYIYCTQHSSRRSKRLSDLNSNDLAEANTYLGQFTKYDDTIDTDIIPHLASANYDDIKKMFFFLLNAQTKLLEIINKPLVKQVKELYTYALYILSNVNNLIAGISQKISMHKFRVVGEDKNLDVSIAPGFEQEFYADVLSVFTNELSGTNINNKQQGNLILGSLSNENTLLELLRNYKVVIAPSLTIREFEVLIKTQFSNIKSFVINQVIKHHDSTTLSYKKYTDAEKQSPENCVSSYIKGTSSNKVGKAFVANIDGIHITDNVVLDIEKQLSNANTINVWEDLAYLVIEKDDPNKITPEFYISVLGFMNKHHEEAKNCPGDASEIEGFTEEVYSFLDKYSELAYKYISVVNELGTFVNGEKSINQSNLAGLFTSVPPLILDGISSGPTTERYLNSRDLVNRRINELRSLVFQDDVLSTIYPDDPNLVDNLSSRSKQLIEKYGVAFIFNIMLGSHEMESLFEYEYSLIEANDPNSRRGFRTPDLILRRNPGEDDFEYLKRVWGKVSKITSFEYRYHSDGSPMTYSEILLMYKMANNSPVPLHVLFRHVCRKNGLTGVSMSDHVTYQDAVEQFKCLKMNLYEAGAATKAQIYAPYIKTILWDKIMYKSEMLGRIDECVFTSSIIRKAVDYVIHDFSRDASGSVTKKVEANSNILDVGLIMEIPSTSTRSILLYLDFAGVTPDGYALFKPSHILSDVSIGDSSYEIFFSEADSEMVPVTLASGDPIENPIVGYSKGPLTDLYGNIDLRQLIRDRLITRQMDHPNKSSLVGVDLIVSQDGSVVHTDSIVELEILELQDLLASYGITVAEKKKSAGGASK